MKKFMIRIILCILIITVLILSFIIFYPVKLAVHEEQLSHQDDEFIIVEWVRTTGFDWRIIGDEDGFYDCPKFVKLTNKYPTSMNYDTLIQGNKYVCFGKYANQVQVGDYVCDVFNVARWEVLYPVRGCLGGISSYGLTVVDFLNGMNSVAFPLGELDSIIAP